MQKNQLIKLIFIVVLIVGAVASLYPTIQLGSLQKNESKLVEEIQNLTNLDRGDLVAAITEGNLESLVRETCQGDTLETALTQSSELIKLSGKIEKVEGKAIRQGLDLQGGTYLIYEVDLPNLLLLQDFVKNKDERLEDIIKATQQAVDDDGDDFFGALERNFKNRNVKLNRYYGKKGQSDGDIIDELKKQAEDAVDRTLEKIRNRIDQFGVSEPSIQKEGDNRIVVELAGIQNIQRAKKIIGTTALLEFKLVKDSEIVWSVLNDIDRVMRIKRRGDKTEQEIVTPDSSEIVDGSNAEQEEVSLSDLFGGDDDEGDTAQDTSLLVDKKTFEEKPFTSLLVGLGGRYSGVISVAMQNERAVQRILQLPEVQEVIPNDAQFVWAMDAFFQGENEYQRLYLVKKEAELLGSMLKNANVQISSGSQSFSAGDAEVHFELNGDGTKTFARVTGMNVGKQLAIVLDGRVKSAPNIKDKIPSGSGTITGMGQYGGSERFGACFKEPVLYLPQCMLLLKTQLVPSLGHDSINKGKQSVIFGILCWSLFL